ncbi:MAG: GNAT family N-acetyltransferase [Helicobacteraceae bacterium]|nr:GNAT family N-acetyltransferase [Candidatus Sulfurimonas ponti]MBL6972791.1 GNAT family N-acetyltransferase [Sulfurimonas sp.]
MSLELYFLRSSEQKIVADMVKYARLDAHQKYTEFYGLTTKDLGLYALKDNCVVGAIWSRKIDGVPMLNMAVLPEHRQSGVASSMLEQFLLEAGELYEEVQIQVNDTTRGFYEKFGFETLENSSFLIKKLEKKAIIRPSDGYDPRRWMD